MLREDSSPRHRAVGIAALSLMFSLIFPAPRLISIPSSRRNLINIAAAESQTTRTPIRKIQAKPVLDYSRFSHRTHVGKQKLSCNSCHKFPSKNWKEVRKADAAFPDIADFPEHASCLNCHRAQFFARERPAPLICSNCHVNVSPRDTARFLFPSLGDVSDATKKRRDFVSEFALNFPHDKHMDVLGSNSQPSRDRGARLVYAGFQKEKPKEESDPKICLICHQTHQPQGNSAEEYVTKAPKTLGDAFWLKKGTFKTIPASHASCSTCHSSEAGIDPLPSKCEVCHKLLPAPNLSGDFDPQLAATMGISDRIMLGRWQRRQSSGAFPHEGGIHPTLACTSCHSIPTMNTAEAKTLKVSVKSCGGAEGCHVTATADEGGALNYEINQRKAKTDFECTKCHLVFGRQPVPASHSEAIPKAVTK